MTKYECGEGGQGPDNSIHSGLMKGHSVCINMAATKLRHQNSLQLPNRHTAGLLENQELVCVCVCVCVCVYTFSAFIIVSVFLNILLK